VLGTQLANTAQPPADDRTNAELERTEAMVREAMAHELDCARRWYLEAPVAGDRQLAYDSPSFGPIIVQTLDAPGGGDMLSFQFAKVARGIGPAERSGVAAALPWKAWGASVCAAAWWAGPGCRQCSAARMHMATAVTCSNSEWPRAGTHICTLP
jgi:hypothetical protein